MKRINELFDSGDKKKRLSHVKNLVLLGCADGHFDENEIKLVSQIAVRIGLKNDEITRVLERPDSVTFYPPSSSKERIEQLFDLVLVMMIDGEIHHNEMALCKIIALKLGFNPTIINKIVEDIITIILSGIANDIAINKLLRQYKTV